MELTVIFLSPNFYCIHFSYDDTVGVFTVPPGGDGLYYFSSFFLVENTEFAQFSVVLNDVVVASSFGDGNTGLDQAQATCSAVVDVSEGKIIN